MKKTLIAVLVLLLSPLVACDVDAPQTPDNLVRIEAASAPLPFLLPEGTLLAVEVRGLAGRWSEIRSIPAIADFQDQLFSWVGLSAGDVRLLVSGEAVAALVVTSGGRESVPVVLLRPNAASADSILASIETSLTVIRDRGAVWLGAKSEAEEIERLARGDGTSLGLSVPLDELELRLAVDGLLRGWVNPSAVRRVLRVRVAGPWWAALDLAWTLISAELDVLRWLGFRRDIESGRVVTDAVAVYDTDMLPREMARVFNSASLSPEPPSRLPEGIVLMAAFRPEPQMCLPWLRFAARRYPDGPLRNLDFWLAEFEERSGHELEQDLFGAIGEQGWLMVLESPGEEVASWVTVLAAPNAHGAETVLLALREWSVEHAWVRTLGMAVPEIRDYDMSGTVVNSVVLRTPFGDLSGPAFATVDGYLVAGSGERAVGTGLALVEEGTFGADRTSTQQHMTVEMRGSFLRYLSGMIHELTASRPQHVPFEAFAGLLANVSSVTTRIWYETDAIRVRSEVQLIEEQAAGS
jgi:hypothetical protein